MGSKAMGKDTMESSGMKSERLHTKGFTLIATLLMLLLLSGVAIGLMMMVNTEGKVGATDLQNDVAFHSAEGGIEKMASDLSSVFQNAQSPTASQICGVSSLQPNMVGVTWKDYAVQPASGCSGTVTAQWGQISSGPNQGLWAQIIPVTMLATAALSGGQEVSMTRNAQVALIPVFQFGVFSEGDLSFFSGPDFDMAGPVHTNADLYPLVGSGSTLTFHNQVSAYGNVIRTQLANGFSTSSNYNGNVDIPTAANGCSTSSTNCVAMPSPGTTSPYGDGSVTGAGSATAQTGASYNTTNWNPFSKVTTNYLLINGNYGNTATPGTGSKKLSMPFVSGTKFPYEIIRRPPSGEASTSALGQSREYNLAQIHVLITDDPAELPGGASDANNVRLANVVGSNVYGIPTSVASTMPAPPAGSSYTTMFAMGFTYIPDPSSCSGTYCATGTLPQDWPYAPATPAAGALTLQPTSQVPPPPVQPGFTYNPANPAPTISVCNTSTCVYPYYSTTANASNAVAWNLIDGYLRVEYKDASGNWNPVTMEWLQLGFARGLTPPTAPGTNPVNPNAILLLQEPADRNADGVIDQTGRAPHCNNPPTCTSMTYALPPEVILDNGQPTVSGTPWYAIKNSTMFSNSWTGTNYYPINFYDAREGESRDTGQTNNSCSVNGVMNAVEIDVGNLKRWLSGAIGTSGGSVDYLVQNGYVLYFSDRRGMLPNPNNSNTKTGDAGLEDVINTSSSTGTPDGALDPVPSGRTLSPEDVNQNGLLDAWGTANLGLGEYNGTVNLNGQIIVAAPDNPFSPRINSCATTARKNWVSGARRVLRLVDGSLGNVPVRTDAGATLASPGGFTVASENPVYIQGHYNTNATDTAWTTGTDMTGHSSASVIADAVTFLSNNWSDWASLGIGGDGTATNPSNRAATSTRYRVAIAGGKNVNFPKPSWGGQDFGTDGGTHNFLRYLENWGGQVLSYKGSIVSLYYSTYDTGIFKCCTTVYSPPTRNYSFDLDFATPGGLPPGTPMFRDVESLGYRQLFTARSN
jgi:Tfp pilus assembly protein PilX